MALYVGSNSLPKLAAFLRGYEHALRKFGIATDDHFLRHFQEWITKYFSVSISKSWEDIISFHSADDSEAMERFWELLDKYLAETKADLVEKHSQEPSSGLER